MARARDTVEHPLHQLLAGDQAFGQLTARFPKHQARAAQLAVHIAIEHRAARQHDGRKFTVAAAIRAAGVVLSHPVVSTTPSNGYPASISTRPR